MHKKLLKSIESICNKICIYSLLLMALVTFTDVFGRLFFNEPLGFAYELVAILLAISFYAGLCQVNRKRQHIQIDLLNKYFKGTIGVILNWFCYLVELTFFTALVVMVYEQVVMSADFGEVFMFLNVEKWKVLALIFGLAFVSLISLLQAFPAAGRVNMEGSR
ncbi:TRAP transporter small permease [Pseudoalteromonas translucida]|nr:TRAP transporter small permease [Pseudoalteromonas translucida]